MSSNASDKGKLELRTNKSPHINSYSISIVCILIIIISVYDSDNIFVTYFFMTALIVE